MRDTRVCGGFVHISGENETLDVDDICIFNGDHEDLEIIDSFDFDHSYNIVIIYKWQRDLDAGENIREGAGGAAGLVC
jgi:hypothetical protein